MISSETEARIDYLLGEALGMPGAPIDVAHLEVCELLGQAIGEVRVLRVVLLQVQEAVVSASEDIRIAQSVGLAQALAKIRSAV